MRDPKKLMPFGVAFVENLEGIDYLTKITAVTFAADAAEACRRVRKFWPDTRGRKLFALNVYAPIMVELLQRLADGPMSPTAAVAMYADLEAVRTAALARGRRKRSDAGRKRVAVVAAPALPPPVAAAPGLIAVPGQAPINPFPVVRSLKAPASAPSVVKPGVNDQATVAAAAPLARIEALLIALAERTLAAPVAAAPAAAPVPAPVKAKKPVPAGLLKYREEQRALKASAARANLPSADARAAFHAADAAYNEAAAADAAADRPPLEAMGLDVNAPVDAPEAAPVAAEAPAPVAAPADASQRQATKTGRVRKPRAARA